MVRHPASSLDKGALQKPTQTLHHRPEGLSPKPRCPPTSVLCDIQQCVCPLCALFLVRRRGWGWFLHQGLGHVKRVAHRYIWDSTWHAGGTLPCVSEPQLPGGVPGTAGRFWREATRARMSPGQGHLHLLVWTAPRRHVPLFGDCSLPLTCWPCLCSFISFTYSFLF